MGFLNKLNQKLKYERRETRTGKLAKELENLHANTVFRPWQIDRIKEIRAAYQAKCHAINRKADELIQEQTELFAQFEIDFIYASEHFKKENPGKEWKPKEAGIGAFARAFWNKFVSKGKSLGIPSYGEVKG